MVHDKDGIKRTAVDLQADEVEFLSARNEATATQGKTNSSPVDELEPVDDGDMPF